MTQKERKKSSLDYIPLLFSRFVVDLFHRLSRIKNIEDVCAHQVIRAEREEKEKGDHLHAEPKVKANERTKSHFSLEDFHHATTLVGSGKYPKTIDFDVYTFTQTSTDVEQSSDREFRPTNASI